MGNDTGREAEVVAGSFQAVTSASVRRHGQLRIHGSQIEEDVGKLEADVVLGYGPLGVVAKGRIPDEVQTDIDGKFGTHPNKLSGILLEFADTTGVRF